MRLRSPGTWSLALATGHILTGPHSRQQVLPGPPHYQRFLEQRQSPEAVWVTGKSETCGRQQGADCKHEDRSERGDTEVNEH